MSKQCPACSVEIKNNSSQWANKIYCSKECRKAAHRKKKSKISRAQQRRSNMRQNEEVLRLVRECRRAGTVQILTGHNLESFIETMRLVRERPKGDVRLCHIAPVKGTTFIGLFHYANLFYGGTYQNKRFGNKYIAGGLFISHKDLKSKWRVGREAPANEVLLKIEEFLGDIIQKYLEVTPVRKSKKYQLIERIIELEGGGDPECMMSFNHACLVSRLDNLCKKTTPKNEYVIESKFLAYMDGLSRFISYRDERVGALRKLRKTLVIAYMALERIKESGTYNKCFYVAYEPLLVKKYAYAMLADATEWSVFKDFIYNAVFLVLQGASLDINSFRREMMSYLIFPKNLEELLIRTGRQ
ncbi:MAG: Recombinase domain-containing protein [Pseudomonas shahriarae]|jgi:hypothetical protein|uniref:hypothetical protein n=1 Tax=Pseudomonas shahriarae TaxID=2745512 RepID=UPI003A0FBB8A